MQDDASEAEITHRICAVLSPELADLFRNGAAPAELVPMLKEKRAALEEKQRREVRRQ